MLFLKSVLFVHVSAFVFGLPMTVGADYACYCSYNNQDDVFDNPNTTGLSIGFIHIGDCLPQANDSTDSNSSLPVTFNGEV